MFSGGWRGGGGDDEYNVFFLEVNDWMFLSINLEKMMHPPSPLPLTTHTQSTNENK